MKKSFITLMAAVVLSVGAFAQTTLFNVPRTEREKEVERLKSEIFTGGGVESIPYVPAHQLSDWADKGDKVLPKSDIQPLSSNPGLYEQVRQRKEKAGELNVAASLNQAGWGTMVSAEDGTRMLYTLEPIPSDYVFGIQQYYKGITFAYYTESLELIKKFDLFSNTDTTQSFNVMSNFSTRFFNADTKLEFAIKAHSFSGEMGSGPASCRDTIYIVNEDGEILSKLGNTSGVMIHQVKSGYSTQNRISVVKNNYTDISDTAVIEVYKAADILKEEYEPLHTFKIANNLTSYSEAPLFALETFDGETYYVEYRYEKPFIANGDNMNPEVEKDNRFLVTMYNPSDFSVAKTIPLPMIGMDENEWSLASILYFDEYRFSKHKFNSDDKLEIVYAMSRYVASCDCNILEFYLIDEDGNVLKELVKNVGGITRLQDLPGKDTEYALWRDKGNGVESITMYNIERNEELVDFKAVHNGDLISLYYERVVDVNGETNYVIKLGRAESTETGTYGVLVYYDQQGKEVRRVRLDIGERAATFDPILSGETLNPYAFVADDKQEYIWFQKEYTPDGGTSGAFIIGTEDGVLYEWRDEAVLSLDGAGLLPTADNTRLAYLYVAFLDQMTYERRTDFYTLPLVEVVLEGEGTEENPYIITTPAQLDAVRKYPTAYFELGNDIDMSSFTGLNGLGFIAIDEFKGHFDGKNRKISNIKIYGKSDAGLFASLTDATVKNLRMENVSFSSNTASNYGAIAGRVSGCDMQNCHVVSDIELSVSGYSSNIGGLVGQWVGSQPMNMCSFEGEIRVSGDAGVGGIAGMLGAGSIVTNSVTKGKIIGGKESAGIAGKSYMNSLVSNCYSSMDVDGFDYAGGIIATSKGFVEKTLATGKIVSKFDTASSFPRSQASGLVGDAQMSMMPGKLSLSVALNDTVMSANRFARVAYAEVYQNYAGNKAMDSNYALETMVLGRHIDSLEVVAASDTNTKLDRMHGQGGTLETFNQAFYEEIGWGFGEDSIAPWVMSGEHPRLWFEFKVRAVELPFKETTILKGESLTLNPRVIPSDATNKNVRYKSSDVAVASVSQDGVVKANNAGSAVITVTTEEGGFTTSCVVNVSIPVEQVIIESDSYRLAPYGSEIVKVTVLPENATNKNVLFRSLNQAVVLCYGSAILGVAEGVAQVVAVSEDGRASDTCEVVVAIPVEDIVLNESSISLSNEQPTFRLVAEVYPEGASTEGLVWSSTDEAVATVDQNGMVRGLTKGSTVVTVTAPDDMAEASCYVEVIENINVGVEGAENGYVVAMINDSYLCVSSSVTMKSVQIWNASGVAVGEVIRVGAKEVRVPASAWSQGLYLVRIELDNGSVKIVKVIK